MALLALQSNANQLLSFNIQNDEYLPSTALPVFRSPEHAIEFRESVLKLVDTRSFVWTVSLCRKTNEATFQSSVSSTYDDSLRIWTDVRSKKFNTDDWFIDEMIFRNIGCFAVSSFDLNMELNKLVLDGSFWFPNTVESLE